MKTNVLILLLALSSLLPAAGELSLVPWPDSIELRGGKPFRLERTIRILYGTREEARPIENSLQPLAEVLAGELELITGIKPEVVKLGTRGITRSRDIILDFEKLRGPFAETEAEEDQSYLLSVGSNTVTVTSQYYKGVACGTATLLQALVIDEGWFVLPLMTIRDKPASPFRAVMIDVARKVHSVDVIKDVIRMARMYKIRYVPLHLTDDQNFTFPFEPVTGKITGNFAYTREQLVDLVAYAEARGVTLIPELDLPGHSSKLKASGYLDPGKTDADVAAPENYAKIHAIIDDMLGVFVSSPYFHIGGDESSAGSSLVPFLESMNKHVRGNPAGGKRRLMVWEGFHGAPTRELPAKGEDRVVVLAWESSYNAPWDLLEAGYEIINASWKPMYVVGGGTLVHPGSSGGRKFRTEDIYRWSKDIFMHWEPGRPVYEDRGPKDPDRTDHEWNARWIGRENQISGGQLLFWEQKETSVINQLRPRVAAMAERLWNPGRGDSYGDFMKRARKVDERIMIVVQPVEILPEKGEQASLISDLYEPYEGKSIRIAMRNRSRIPGTIRFEAGGFSNNLTWIDFSEIAVPTVESRAGSEPIEMTGGFGVRARLHREDGTRVEGHTWKFYNNWPDRVEVTDYRMERKAGAEVPALEGFPDARILRRYRMPMLRGPLRNVELFGQVHRSVLTPPGGGTYEISMKTQSGHATLYLDLNRNGAWDAGEALIRDTPNTEAVQSAQVELRAGEGYDLRVDHKTGMPRPVLLVYLDGPGTEGRKEVSPYLGLPNRPRMEPRD